MFICNAYVLFTGLAMLPMASLAHRTIPNGMTCGPQFGSPNTPLVIPNAAISWASYSIHSCDDPIQWYEADVSAGQPLYFTVTIPEIERFADTRMAVVFLGPGLEDLSSDVGIPDSIVDYATANGMGGALFKSPEDQSTCGHLTSQTMIDAVTVKDSRCHFYEPFGGSNLWVVMDEELIAPEAGTYKIAVYEQAGNTAKASFACCDWPEDFVTPYNVPDPECAVCGSTADENPAWTSLYFEHKTMADYGGYPPLQNCLEDSTPIPLPEGEGCPDLSSLFADPTFINQPSSCAMGCSSTGECHSHNVFGECTHVVDWALNPKVGDANVTEVVIFKGDKIRFVHLIDDGLAHNLYMLADEMSINTCNFTGAQEVALVGEIKIGHDYTFDQAGIFHFTCSIGCSIDPEILQSRQQSSAPGCHCQIGQKLRVEVKDATDGLRCHDHVQTGHAHSLEGISKSTMNDPLACPPGTSNARAINNDDYGSIGESECSEQCAPEMAIGFMTGVELGSCVDLGYTHNPITTSVQPPGAPMEVEVTILSNVAIGGSQVSKSTCHCHSYEEIVCPEQETPEDTLYVEHIEEIEAYCQGILDGLELDCPYKCFQPMEVLHLHYLECPTRVIDPQYILVNATNMCHIAANAPDDTDTCPVVDLYVPETGTIFADGGPTLGDASSGSKVLTGAVLGISLLLLPLLA